MTSVAIGVSLQIFLLDVVKVKVYCVPTLIQMFHDSVFSFNNIKVYTTITDGGLLRFRDFICESGLGCFDRPPGWISGELQ